MTEPERVNWRSLITELEAAGVGEYMLAKMLGLQQVQVQRIKGGFEPKHHTGQRIVEIHREYVSRGTQAPAQQ